MTSERIVIPPFMVTKISGPPRKRLQKAMKSRSVPRIGSPHWTEPGYVLVGRRGIMADQKSAEITLTYGKPAEVEDE